MKNKTKIAQISIVVVTLLLTAFPVRADDLAAPVPAPADFWVRDQPDRITQACTGTEPETMDGAWRPGSPARLMMALPSIRAFLLVTLSHFGSSRSNIFSAISCPGKP
jgi:hypothetical protein